ncbi:hypothetical protein L2E82_53395 [Cichorium intybus]|nr:hypothetical protein L2E82_53395 [Cichorium intybus]
MMRPPARGPCDPSSYHESSQQRAEPASTFYLIMHPFQKSGLLHVLALELLRLSEQAYDYWQDQPGMAAQETHPDAQGKQSLVALLKRYARVEVAAQADIQPPVTKPNTTHAPLR